jgi:hypothetical protein
MSENMTENIRENPQRHNRAVWNHLHPFVYFAAAGCLLWFVLLAWVFFGGQGYTDLALVVVSGFFLMAMAVPFVLWLVYRKYRSGSDGSPSLREWAAGDFEIQQGRRKAVDAAIEILLPLAAAAVGMTAMGLVFHFSAAGIV